MYTNLNDMENDKNTLERKLRSIVNITSKKVYQEFKKSFPQKIMKIKSEILGSFKVIVYSTFQKVFYEEYGNNFDVNALNNSIVCMIDDNLRPYLSYEVIDFNSSDNYNKDKRAFNQNAKIDGSFRNFMNIDEINSVDEADYFGMNVEEINSPYEYAQTETTMAELAKKKVFSGNSYRRPPKEVYQEAEIQAYQDFFEQYDKKIKPHIKTYYGITL